MFTSIAHACVADRITVSDSEIEEYEKRFEIVTNFLDVIGPLALLIIGLIGVTKGAFSPAASWGVLSAGIAIAINNLFQLITGIAKHYRMQHTG